MFAVLLLLLSVSSAFAQIEQVEIRVDGLACPFCSYGLEKKLKEIKGVEKVIINVDKGLVTLKGRKEGSIMVERLEPVVKDAGFTPGEISLTAIGRITQLENTPMFQVSGPEMTFIIKSNSVFEKLHAELAGMDKLVRVTGRLAQETPAGHHAHPHTLTIEEYTIK
jgi:copper chaperone CopZ